METNRSKLPTDPESPWFWMAWWGAVLDGRDDEAERILSGKRAEVPRG